MCIMAREECTRFFDHELGYSLAPYCMYAVRNDANGRILFDSFSRSVRLMKALIIKHLSVL